MSSYIDLFGVSMPSEDLKSDKAKELAFLLKSKFFEYASFVKNLSDSDNNTDTIIFDIEVELAQKKINKIKPVERIACVFSQSDEIIPAVYALRDDFPLVPHLNLTEEEYPRCLCLFDENYDDMKIRWSNNELIIRIANWLSKTSMGKLHTVNQPLEPLLAYSSDTLILPDDYFTESISSCLYQFIPIKSKSGRTTYIAQAFNFKMANKCYIDVPVTGKPVVHGIIRKRPKNLYELSQFAKDAEIDIIKILEDMCKRLISIGLAKEQYHSYEFVLILYLPKTRAIGFPTEGYDIRAFIFEKSILEVGISLGVYGVMDGMPGQIFNPDVKERIGEDIPVHVLNVQEAFSRDLAARISGYSVVENRITMIGAGALGSHLFLNSLKTGFGRWTIIDDDEFFPHNMGRHTLNIHSIGRSKAIELVKYGNTIVQTKEQINYCIPTNILKPTAEYEDKIQTALENADIIVDASTSIAVERFLAFYPNSNARRVSAFFNPTGTDLVMLIESKNRSITCDFLEIQYYRNLIYTPELEMHIKTRPDQIRYSSSCRDITNRIPQENIVALSSICYSFLRRTIDIDEGAIHIWHINQENFDIKSYNFPVFDNIAINVGMNWTIVIDEFFEKKLIDARKERLPFETGGVLLGSYDMSRKIIYIVDTITSPPDSVERPTSYIRGCYGLEDKVNKIAELTQDKLDYVGEWHSHPCGCSGKPSDYDVVLLDWVTSYMAFDGHPSIMIICSDSGLNFNIGGVMYD